MFTRNISKTLSRIGFTAKLCFLFIFFSSSIGFAQTHQFSKDSIPVVNEEVVFSTTFNHDLMKKVFYRRAYFYLNDKLNPHSGFFLTNNEDSTICTVTDYIDIESSAINTYAVYVTYDIHLTYEDGYCNMIIKDITYMGKTDFENQQRSKRKLNMTEYSGKDLMIDEKFTWLFKKNSSKKITEATIERFNQIITDLDSLFSQ